MTYFWIIYFAAVFLLAWPPALIFLLLIGICVRWSIEPVDWWRAGR